jgi:hypothetical protein
MSSPGTLRFAEVAVKPSAPPAGYNLIYVKTDDILYLQDSSGIETPLGSSAAITSLTGEATASGPGSAVITLSNSAVIGKVLTGFAPGPNSPVLATDTILQAFQKLQAQVSGTTGTAITALTGDVSAAGPGSVPATVNSVGGKTASDIASAVTTVDAATSSNIASTLVERDASGNFSANIITASLNGNATTATTSTNFSGSLTGDVTGTQSATVVSLVGGQSAASVATAATSVAAATSANTPNTLVKRDGSGNFSAGIISANLSGNVTGGTITGLIHTTGLQRTVTSKTTNYTATLNDDLIEVDASGGSVTITLPLASTANVYTVVKTDNSANTVVIVPSFGDTISGFASVTLHNQFDTYTFDGDGFTEYFIESAIIAGTGPITALTGDVSAIGPGSAVATVNFVGGSSAANIHSAELAANAATSSNTPNTIVKRDGSGNFSASTITANLTGTATNATTAVNFSGSLSGDVSGTQTTTSVDKIKGTSVNATAPTDAQFLVYQNGITAYKPVSLSGDVTMTDTGVASLVATTNSTITTLSVLSLPGSQVTGNISGNAANVTGVVAIVNGGTGQTTQAAAFDALSPTTTKGDLIAYDTGTNIRVPVGTNGQVLTADSSQASGLSYTTPTTGTVTSVALSLPSIFNVTGSPVTTSGTLTATFNTETANTVFAGPASGGPAIPTFRLLVSADIPNNAANTTGTASNITASSNTTLTSLPNLTSAPSLSVTGSQVGGFTQGSVIFAGPGGTLAQDNSEFYWNDTTFNLGLGVIPATNIALDIVNTTGASKAIQTTSYGVGSTIPFRGRFARGTSGSPAAAQSGDNLSVLSGRGYGTSQFATASTGAINIVAGETFTNASNATYLQFQVTPTGSVTIAEAMRLSSAGNLLIGTTTDSGTQKLQVNGNSNVGTVTAGTWNGSTIAVGFGGTGLSTTPTNGQLLIGNGTGYTLSTLTAGNGINITNASGSVTIASNNTTAITTKTANYTILSTDGTILCDTSGGAFTLTLPSPTALAGKLFRIIDSTGFFQTNNLTLAPSGAEKIEGLAASKVLQTPWGWFTVTTNGTDWFIGG